MENVIHINVDNPSIKFKTQQKITYTEHMYMQNFRASQYFNSDAATCIFPLSF